MRRETKDKIWFVAWIVLSVSIANLLGFSEEAGLFGALLVGGLHILDSKNRND